MANSINSLNTTIANRNILNIGYFTGNIDAVGVSGGLPGGTTHAWVSTTDTSGTFPSGSFWAVLETIGASALMQTLTVYRGGVYTRVYANAAWTEWTQFATLTDTNGLIRFVSARQTVSFTANVMKEINFSSSIPSGYTCVSSQTVWGGSGYGNINRIEIGSYPYIVRILSENTISFTVITFLVCVKSGLMAASEEDLE